jgi:Family of unknown function (DUF5309)
MATVAGLRGSGTADWGTDERPKNFREMILWRQPNGMAPLTALMSKMSKETTDDPEFAWYEEELAPIRLTVNYTTGYASTVTNIVVDGGDALDLVAGDILLAEAAEGTTYADEILQVVAAGSTTALTLTRGAAGSTANTLANNMYITKIGNAYAEGTTSPTVTTRNPTKLYNYTQIFKTAYELTNTAKETNFRTGDAKQNDKKRRMFDHSVALEMAWLFGKRWEGATSGSNGKPLRMTGGLLNFLDTYGSSSLDAATAMTSGTGLNPFFDVVYSVFDYNTASGAGDERIAFCGNGALNALQKAAAASGQVNFGDTIKVYGMNFTKFVMPQGTLYIKTHPLMNVNTRFTNSMFIIDPTAIKYRPLRNRDTKFMDNIQANDADSNKGQWITEAGLEIRHLKTMKYLGAVSYS